MWLFSSTAIGIAFGELGAGIGDLDNESLMKAEMLLDHFKSPSPYISMAVAQAQRARVKQLIGKPREAKKILEETLKTVKLKSDHFSKRDSIFYALYIQPQSLNQDVYTL